MEAPKQNNFAENLREYISVQYELAGLQLAERTAVSGSSMLSRLIVFCLMFVALLFFSLGMVLYLRQLTEDLLQAVLITGAFYLLLALVLWLFRKTILETPLRNSIIRSFIKH